MHTTKTADRQIPSSDGRKLGYNEHGDPQGKPVFFMHGFPGSRLDWQMLDPANCAAEQNACIIAVDRPGMGLSEYKRGRVPVASSMKRQYTHGRGDSGSRISRPKFTYGMGKTITMFPVRSVAMLPKPSPQLPGDILTK